MSDFDTINAKLDLILKLLGPVPSTGPEPKPVPFTPPPTAPAAPQAPPAPFGYPSYPPGPVLNGDSPDKGVNHWCVTNSDPITVAVQLPGLSRIDTVATADSPARGGTTFHLALKDVGGNVVRSQSVVGGATLLFDGLEGNFTLSFWSDDLAHAWVIYR